MGIALEEELRAGGAGTARVDEDYAFLVFTGVV